MKIRTGFVSNSSSSSFVVVGRKVRLSDVSLDDFKNKNYMIETDYSYDARVNIYTKYFSKNELEALYDLLVNPPKSIRDNDEDQIIRHTLIEVFEYGSDSGELKVEKGRIPDACDLIIFYGEEDQHSPTVMKEINEMFEYGEY